MTLNEIEEVRKMVNRLSGDTPSNMAFGGIYDQIGGGFSRYSVDEKWLVGQANP